MKKIISMLACCVMLLACTQALAAEPITVVLDCAPVEFTQEPVILNDRTLVPVRAIFEAMGASVDWNGETQTAVSYTHLDVYKRQAINCAPAQKP